MKLSELLQPEMVLPKIACASKDELIIKLVDLVYDTGREFPLSKKDLLETINRREKIGGTLLPSGLSIPHARLKGFEDFVFAVGTPALPLFHEGQEILMAAMMITSQSGGLWYLGVLAALTKISKNREFFSRLSTAETAVDILNILREQDQELC